MYKTRAACRNAEAPHRASGMQAWEHKIFVNANKTAKFYDAARR